MAKVKVIVSGLCPFCEEEHPVFIKNKKDEILDSENYLMEKHRKLGDSQFCKGEGVPPQAIVVKVVT